MDQEKIGRFIAERRKAKSLTQVALGEKLGVSNKAVSKWERGICLPDVSLYQDLCMVLGISLNEFFAGEFIDLENLEMTSENNLISLSASGSSRKKKLLRIIAALCIVLFISLITVAALAKNAYNSSSAEVSEEPAESAPPLYHCLETWELTDREQVLLGLVLEEDLDWNLFRYNTGSSFTGGFSVDMTVFQKGEKVSEKTIYEMDYWEKCRHDGEIAVMTNWDDPSEFIVKATVNGSPGEQGTTGIDLSEYLDDSWFDAAEDGRKVLKDEVDMARSQLYTGELAESESGKLRIGDGNVIPLVMYGWNHGGSGSIPEIGETLGGEVSCDTDVVVLFSVTFHKN